MEFNPNYKLRKGHEKEDLERLTKGMEELDKHIEWIEGYRNVDISIEESFVDYVSEDLKWRDSHIRIQPTWGEIEYITFKSGIMPSKLNLEKICFGGPYNFGNHYIQLEINKQIYAIFHKSK